MRQSESDFIKNELTDAPPLPCHLKVGDVVTYTNEFGVHFEGKKVIGFSKEPTSWGAFVHLSKSAYWFPVPPKSCKVEKVEA